MTQCLLHPLLRLSARRGGLNMPNLVLRKRSLGYRGQVHDEPGSQGQKTDSQFRVFWSHLLAKAWWPQTLKRTHSDHISRSYLSSRCDWLIITVNQWHLEKGTGPFKSRDHFLPFFQLNICMVLRLCEHGTFQSNLTGFVMSYRGPLTDWLAACRPSWAAFLVTLALTLLSDLGVSRRPSPRQEGGAYLRITCAACWSHRPWGRSRGPCHITARGSSPRRLGNRGGTQCRWRNPSPGPAHPWGSEWGHLLLELQWELRNLLKQFQYCCLRLTINGRW